MDLFAKPSHVTQLPLEWEEVRNKLGAFSLFEHVDLELNISTAVDHSLPALVHKARSLGSYDSVWAVEGVGHYYVDALLSRGKPLFAVWTNQQTQGLPSASLVPLHAGIGLALAEWLLADSRGLSGNECSQRVEKFLKSCQQTFQQNYLGIIYEALGLVTRNLYPHLMPKMHLWLARSNAELPEYFWHGVGRALYFSPSSFLPGHSAPWKAFEMCRKEPPNVAGRRNAVAGFVWALALVNIRQPYILAEFLFHHGNELQEEEAVVNGICSALIIWTRSCSNNNDLTRMNSYQCEGRRSIISLWNKYVGKACRNALLYCSTKAESEPLGKLFHYQTPQQLLADFVRSDLSG